MNTSGTSSYWHPQDVNQLSKTTHLQFPINHHITSQYHDTMNYYNELNSTTNQMKRSHSGSNRQASPIKKRPFIPPPVHSSQPPITSSADHTDDDEEDDDEEIDSMSTTNSHGTLDKTQGTKRDENRRRAAHTAAEQKRRNAIRKGYDALQSLVPNSHLLDPISSQKVSKAAILKRSTDYLIQLNHEKQQLNLQLEAKRKDTYCLRAVQKTYEDILEMNLNSARNAGATIDDEYKFKVFQNLADALFISYDQSMQSAQITDFHQFTSTIIRWIEDSCRPVDVNDVIRRVLTNFKS